MKAPYSRPFGRRLRDLDDPTGEMPPALELSGVYLCVLGRVGGGACVCVCARARASVCVCVCVCKCGVCVCVCFCARALECVAAIMTLQRVLLTDLLKLRTDRY